MASKTQHSKQNTEGHQDESHEHAAHHEVFKFKKRMLKWSNPVEYVNNMYGCHPDDNNNEYFKKVFGK